MLHEIDALMKHKNTLTADDRKQIEIVDPQRRYMKMKQELESKYAKDLSSSTSNEMLSENIEN